MFHRLNWFADYVPISECILFILIITSWKCLITSHMSSSFKIGKQDTLFTQSDMKIWELHRSYTSMQKGSQNLLLPHDVYTMYSSALH